MEIKINISAEGKTLNIQDNTLYLNEGFSFFNYTKNLCKSIILIESHETSLTSENIPKLMTGGFGKSINITKDGYITLHYIILPTKEWVYSKDAQKIISQLSNPYIYYVDDDKIYSYDNEQEISKEDLLRFCYNDTINSRIFRTHKEYVNIKNLYNCYINYCLQLLLSRGLSRCNNKNNINSEIIYKRDLVWMAINVINYYIDLHCESNPTLEYVLSIIEMIHSCNGICSENNNQIINYDCGCSKR